MRSREELLYRLGQEAGNLWLYVSRPRWTSKGPIGTRGLPDGQSIAQALRGTAYAAEVERTAEAIVKHRFPLLGIAVDTGPDIAWRRDYVSGIATRARYFRRIPYLDAHRVGDHKVIWELNRHQHWILLAQAWLLTGRREFLDEIWAEYASWTRQNPFQRGVNWTSALEVAFRALSWLWVLHLAGSEMPPDVHAGFIDGLYRHGLHIERNLSVYFSPNTHLLGEAVALHALGTLVAPFPERWVELGAALVREAIDRQIRPDGSHFEQSSYYHLYALDMFLFHAAIAGADGHYRDRLAAMAAYAADLMGPQRTLPFLGDDDGGRFFHPFGDRDRFGRATLAACAAYLNRPEWLADAADLHELAAWWLGERAFGMQPGKPVFSSKLYQDAGIAVMAAGPAHVVVDAGPFGAWTGGHSHSDTLSLVARAGGRDILIDPGTFTYAGDRFERDRFRRSAAHNTVRIDGLDQASPGGTFRWSGRPEVRILDWRGSPAEDFLAAECRYSGFTHRRHVLFRKPDVLEVEDFVDGPAGNHVVEQFWHLACDNDAVRTSDPAVRITGWRSRAYGHREPAPVLRVLKRGPLPMKLSATVLLRP
ncbi:MAG: alginate lyase family protein [bacterium]|jgi:hypothetical protein